MVTSNHVHLLVKDTEPNVNRGVCGLVYREIKFDVLPSAVVAYLILAIPADFWCFRLTWDIINLCHDVKTSCSSFGRDEYVSG
jgi:hypothetical protein